MITNVDRQMFHDAFKAYDRTESFSHAGLNALFDWLEHLEIIQDKAIELDVISLCCEFAEDEIEAVLKDYGLSSLKDLEDRTDVVWHNETHVLYIQY